MAPEIPKRPFGYDPIEAEEYVKKHSEDEVKRIYVDMVVKYSPAGQITPVSFVWDDGREYDVGKIIRIVKGSSLKVFSSGFRFLCQKGNRRYYKYYDGERWYMELRPYNL